MITGGLRISAISDQHNQQSLSPLFVVVVVVFPSSAGRAHIFCWLITPSHRQKSCCRLGDHRINIASLLVKEISDKTTEMENMENKKKYFGKGLHQKDPNIRNPQYQVCLIINYKREQALHILFLRSPPYYPFRRRVISERQKTTIFCETINHLPPTKHYYHLLVYYK